jgi:hypothetical protein
MKAGDLTVEELRDLIRSAVADALAQGDPDFGLKLRPEVDQRLREQMANPGPTVSLEELVAELGLEG